MKWVIFIQIDFVIIHFELRWATCKRIVDYDFCSSFSTLELIVNRERELSHASQCHGIQYFLQCYMTYGRAIKRDQQICIRVSFEKIPKNDSFDIYHEKSNVGQG